jgi:hypothetical protein
LREDCLFFDIEMLLAGGEMADDMKQFHIFRGGGADVFELSDGGIKADQIHEQTLNHLMFGQQALEDVAGWETQSQLFHRITNQADVRTTHSGYVIYLAA